MWVDWEYRPIISLLAAIGPSASGNHRLKSRKVIDIGVDVATNAGGTSRMHGDFVFDGLEKTVGSLGCFPVCVATRPPVDDEEHHTAVIELYGVGIKSAQRLGSFEEV